jgi:acyl-CoA synthetase (AMP-forming)/AMP-acid ligase II
MSSWNFADVWEVVAEEHPERDAVIQGNRRSDWSTFNRRASRLAASLQEFTSGAQAKVAQYLYNCPEYLESVFASWKAGLVPVNTNYRYADDELVYLWDNADVEVVVFDAAFLERVERIRPRLPRINGWLMVGPDPTQTPDWAATYEEASANTTKTATAKRTPDDLYMLYTGGTTGFPKGVMWRQDDLFAVLNRTAALRYPEEGGLDDVRQAMRQPMNPKRPSPRAVPGPPLMHGTAAFSAFTALSSGGCAVLLPSRSFNAAELLDTIDQQRVTEVSIVGDAFAKPILAELDAHPGRWDLSSLWLIVSSGVMWSADTKAGLLRHHPKLNLIDTLGSSEAIGLAQSRSSAKGTSQTAGFVLSANSRVIDEKGQDVVPGSGQAGLVALRGRVPLGYYKDPEKSATTFRIIDGIRWSVPGDWATVDEDGTIHLLGRGSVCINTGGEKVFPEEVEEALKTHPDVADAVAVGVPHPRFGEAVVAVIQPVDGAILDHESVISHVKQRLASYKAPRHIVTVPTIGRDTNGKVNYKRLKEHATTELANR